MPSLKLEGNTFLINTAGPEPIGAYFQKGAHLGQKEVLNLWYVDTSEN